MENIDDQPETFQTVSIFLSAGKCVQNQSKDGAWITLFDYEIFRCIKFDISRFVFIDGLFVLFILPKQQTNKQTNKPTPHICCVCVWTVNMCWRVIFVSLLATISHFVPCFAHSSKKYLRFAIIWSGFGYFHVGISRQSHFANFDDNSKKKRKKKKKESNKIWRRWWRRRTCEIEFAQFSKLLHISKQQHYQLFVNQTYSTYAPFAVIHGQNAQWISIISSNSFDYTKIHKDFYV